MDAHEPHTPDSGNTAPALPSAKHALLLVLVCLVLGTTAGTAFQLADLLPGIVATEVLCLIAPLVLVLILGRFPIARTLRLRWPGWRMMLGAVLLAPAASIAAGELFWLQSLVVRVPDWYLDMMEGLAAAGRESNIWLGVLALSVFPAVAEETLFRGFVLSGLRKRFGRWTSVGLTALLFAVLHVDPYRFLAVCVLGVFLGFVAVSTGSLYPAIAIHGLNNLLVLVPPEWTEGTNMEWLSGNHGVPVTWLAASIAVLAVGCALLRRGWAGESAP